MMNNILLIGGNGYIGSYLYLNLKNKYNIDIVDINWFCNCDNSKDFRYLNIDFLSNFDVVILLAGHSSVSMCHLDLISSFSNNVINFISLISKIKNQKFIYASSSSVYGQTNKKIVDEEYDFFEPNNYYDLSKQVIDMYISKVNINYYGLRFGTVNGWSPRLRTDIMINSMVYSAKMEGHIKLYIKDIMRPILGIKDLCDSIECIINCQEDKRGIYNLASFNDVAKNIANKVSSITKVPIIEYEVNNLQKITNTKLQTKSYDFSIDSSKFKNNFNFEFKENIESITKSIVDKFDSCEKTNRNINKKYELY